MQVLLPAPGMPKKQARMGSESSGVFFSSFFACFFDILLWRCYSKLCFSCCFSYNVMSYTAKKKFVLAWVVLWHPSRLRPTKPSLQHSAIYPSSTWPQIEYHWIHATHKWQHQQASARESNMLIDVAAKVIFWILSSVAHAASTCISFQKGKLILL